MNAVLVVKSGLSERAECILEPDKSYAIGRGYQADFVIAHRSVSRLHCRVSQAAPDQWEIADAGSHNGTWVNHQRVALHALRHGDVIQLGLVTLEFRLLSTSPAPLPPPVPAAEPPRLPQPPRPPQTLPGADTSDVISVPPRALPAAPEARGPRVALLVGAAAAALLAAAVISILVMSSPGQRAVKRSDEEASRPTAAKSARAKVRRRPPRKGKLIKAITLDGAKGLTPLQTAVKEGKRAEVEALLGKGTDVNAWSAPDPSDKSGRRFQSLHVAVIEDKGELAELLLNKGANPNGNLGFGTPLHMAAATNNVPIAVLLLDRGAAVNARDARRQTPLHLAAANGCEEVAEFLVDSEAEVNSWTSEGLTPLHLAAGNGHASVIKVLLDAGCDPSLPNSFGHWTPLHAAAARGQLGAVQMLLARGAKVNARTSTLSGGGSTPLHEAARGGHKEVAILLLARGADLGARDSDGKTPVQVASAKALE